MGIVAKMIRNKNRKDEDRNFNAIAYTRFSNPGKINSFFTSAEAQEAIIREYVNNRDNITLLEVFSDPGRSGKDTKRPGYQKMISRILEGGVDIVYAYKLDRMGRNDADLVDLEKFLEEREIRLLYTNDINHEDTPMGRYNKRVCRAQAVLGREEAADRVADKYILQLKNGYMSAGLRPLGYDSGKEPGSGFVNKKTAPIVKDIFRLCLDGVRPSEIAREMNTRYGVIPPKKRRNGSSVGGGVPFTENYIVRILLNPYFAGYVYATLAGAGTLDVEYQLYEGKHEPLITKEDWYKAMEILKANRKEGTHNYPQIRSSDGYLLKGYLRCECAGFMTAASASKLDVNGMKYRYYVCAQKLHFRSEYDCNTRISADAIEAIVMATIGYHLKDDIRRVSFPEDSKHLKELNEKLATSKYQYGKLKKELSTTVDMLTQFDDESIKDELYGKMKKLGKELDCVKNKIKDIEREIELYSVKPDITRTRINRELEDLCKLQSGLSPAEKKEILAKVVDKIVLKTEVEHTKLSRTMSITIYPKDEFASRIPATPIRFSINSHSAVCNWHIHGLGIKANRDKLMSKKVSQRRHWLHDVVKWQKKIEAEKLSIREFADKHKLQKSMLSQKLSLLKKLSDTCICYVLNIKLKTESEILSFRALDRLSKMPKDRQFSALKKLLKVSNTCPKK